MRNATLARAWYDEVWSFTLWWWCSSGFLVLGAFIMGDSWTELSPHDVVLRVSWWTTGLALTVALPPMLGFLRQGRVSRHVPMLLGILGPFLLLRVVARVAPGSVADVHQNWTLVAVGGVGIFAAVTSNQLGTRALQRVLRDAGSLRRWDRPEQPTSDGRPGLLLNRASTLLGLDGPEGGMRTGTIAGRRAVVFSGVCTATAVPRLVDRRSRLALLLSVLLTRGRYDDPEDFEEVTSLFLTLVAVQLGESRRFTSFDLRSRARADADVVFHNVEDRVEHFESIELDDHHEVRIPASSSQVEAWSSFTPDVVHELAGHRRLNVRKQDSLLVAYRIGGCGRRAELDSLVEVTTWFAKHMQR
jgi:hypothetical protein